MSTATEPVGACNHPHCYPDAGCALGEQLSECPHFEKSEREQKEGPPLGPGDVGVPWTGSCFGIDDIAWIGSRRRPRLIAPVGAHNAGKTTFLASLYIGLCRGVLPKAHQFVGSFTFGGWEKLAAYVRHAPSGIGPGFPPHTPVTEHRVPGWLHLGLRTAEGYVEDIVLGDAPGEWFSRWSVNPADDGALGARWIMQRADAFLLFVDSDALVGENRRIVAEQTEMLAQRVASIRHSRRVAVVWSKADKSISNTVFSDLQSALRSAFPGVKEFSVSVHDSSQPEATRPFWNVIDWVLQDEVSPQPFAPASVVIPGNPFLAFRG